MSQEIDRRTMLALAGAGVLNSRLNAAQAQLHALRKNGTAPLQFFTASEHQFIDTLAEMILPADEHSPGAHEARVAAYIDLVVANSDDSVKSAWKSGMKAFDSAVRQSAKVGFLDAKPEARAEAVKRVLAQQNGPGAPARDFFLRVRQITIAGYYSSELGLLKELEYKGNQAMNMFPGCEV